MILDDVLELFPKWKYKTVISLRVTVSLFGLSSSWKADSKANIVLFSFYNWQICSSEKWIAGMQVNNCFFWLQTPAGICL